MASNKKDVPWEILMRITKHEKSYIVELSDRSAWRIWPADMADTLQWLPTTEIKIRKIFDEACSHALINQSDGSRVRVIEAHRIWGADEVRRSLGY
jgi:hypothetical protein